MKLPLAPDQVSEMIGVVLVGAAYDAIASTLPEGAALWPVQRDRGQYLIQVEAAVVDRGNRAFPPGDWMERRCRFQASGLTE